MNEELFKKIDEERIKQALESGNWGEAIILFKYSTISKEDFIEIQKNSMSFQEFDKQIRKDFFENNQSAEEEPKKAKKKSGIVGNQKETVWKEILKVISSEISVPSFGAWFENTKGELEGNTLSIVCENSFQKEWLEERYHKLISSSVEEVLGNGYKIKIIDEDR